MPSRSKIHWHAFIVHFPISLYGTAFLFQLLHLLWYPSCFELSSNVTLTLATAAMVPSVWSGWLTWKRQYRGARGKIFRRKIVIGLVMLPVSAAVVAWRALAGHFAEDVPHLSHGLYFAVVTLLIVGAAAEGYYGSRLGHRS